MIPAIALLTLRECFRKPLPYAIAVAIILLALGSKAFLVFSFGAAQAATANLAVSALFLAGFAHAALQGTALLRLDLERGTLGLLLTKPLALAEYLIGRYLGLAAASLAIAAMVLAVLVAVSLALPARSAQGAGLIALLAPPALRAALVVATLDAAALAASVAVARVAAPVALLLLFLAGTLAGALPLIPDFGVFGLDVGASPAWGTLLAYSVANTSFFLLLALILLASKQPLRSPK